MMTDRATSRRRFLAETTKLGAVAALIGSGVPALAREPDRERWQIGCYTRPWDKHDYRVALDAIAAAGFRHVGLMTTRSPSRLVLSTATTPAEADRIGEEIVKRKLAVASVYGGGFPVEKSLAAGIDGLRRLIDHCAAVRSRTLLLGGTGNAQLFDAYYRAIAECCDYAATRKVHLTIKPHGGLNATGPQCGKILDKVARRNFSLWYDPGNIYYYSGGKLDPVEDAATVDGRITGMCVKDYIAPKNVLVTPGKGQVDFPRVLGRLVAGGFRKGPLIIETLTPGDLPALAKQAVEAREFVARLLRSVDAKAATKG